MAKSKPEDKGMKKTDMVRACLEELGDDAKPQAIQEYIKSKFNTELPTAIISNYKSTLKRKAGAPPAPRGRRPAGAGGIQVEDLEAVRTLVGKLGSEQVKRLVDVFGK